jgi:hypothetical protein
MTVVGLFELSVRFLLVVVAVAALSACAEAVQGPRMVTYTPDRFYFRHLPWRDSRSSIELLAGARCEQLGKEAMLESAYQFAALDLRYATYRCTTPELEDKYVLETARNGLATERVDLQIRSQARKSGRYVR